MDCSYECYQIGGPWIDINPNCPVHKPGGLRDQEDEREALEERVRVLEEKVAYLEGRLGEPS